MGTHSRRWFLETGGAGLAGLTLPRVLPAGPTVDVPALATRKTSVILFWLSGGPSHIDMWDPKPDAPREIRGPFGTIPTKLPGVRFCEHLPLQASILDKLTVIRSVDCRASDHTPITLQAGNPLARRTNDGKDGGGYPAMGSVVSKFRGPNDPALPGFVGLAKSWKSDVWGAGHLGSAYEPVKGLELAGKFARPQGISVDRLEDRGALRRQLDRLRREINVGDNMERVDRFSEQALDLVVSGKIEKAFDLDQESAKTRDAYGRSSLGEKALLARRLVEHGVTFTLVSGAWGYFDHHGDEVRWGGIVKGLTPLLPRVDRTLYALVNDLEARGLLDSTLVLMMGEFGRSPVLTKTAGRGHWQNVMSMVMAGGGLRHGQVIGSTDRKGYDVATRRVSPSDLAATVYRYLGIDLDAHWTNPQGRPVPIVTEGGRPIEELF
jgi:hypothetical protein